MDGRPTRRPRAPRARRLGPGCLLGACFLAGAACTAVGLEAQEAPPQTGSLTCFHIRPAPACRGYWIIETQGVVPIASTEQTEILSGPRPIFDDNNVEFNVGYMVNLGPTLSAGGAVVLGSGSGGVPDGARARVRWWVHDAWSLALEGGVVRTNLGSRVGSPLLGRSLGVRANYREFAALLLRYDAVDVPNGEGWSGGPASGWSVGAATSGSGAVAAGALIGVGMLALLVLIGGAG